MPSLLEKIILLTTRTTVGTIACVLVGTLFVYFVLFGKSKKTANVENSTSREIKKDVHDVNKQTKATTTNDEKHTESKKALEEKKMTVDKKSDASVKDVVKPEPFLAQYEATLAIVLRDAANYKPTPIEIKSMNADVKEREITSENVEKSREIKVKEVAAIASIASVAAAASVAVLDNHKDNTPVSKAPEPVLAAFEATTAFTEFKASQSIKSIVSAPEYSQAMTESLENIANSIVASNPVLAEFEATTASTEFEASQSIKSIVSTPEYKHAMIESLENIAVIAAKNTAPSNPVLAAFEATTASIGFEASQSIKAIVSASKYSQAMTESLENIASIAANNIVASNPVLAAFEATTASIEFEASQSIKTIISTPEYSQAMTESLENIASIAANNIVASNPVLAAFEATTASVEFEASQSIKSIISTPEYSQAMAESLENIANSIVASNPVLAAFEATTASVEFEASQSIKTIVSTPEYSQAMTESLENIASIAANNIVVSNPVLAAFEATTASVEFEASQSIKSIVSAPEYKYAMTESFENIAAIAAKNTAPSNPVLALYEATTASTISASHNYINNLTSHDDYLNALKTATSKLQNVVTREVRPTLITNLASLEATTAYQLLQHQQHNTQQHVESDSDIEVEIEDNVLSSPSAVSSVSSTTSSENGTARGIENKPLQINTLDNKSQFDVSWDQMYSNNNTKSTVVESPKSAVPFMSTVDCTYYPNCTNKNCKFVHPGQENNPKPKRAATMDAVYKKPWTKAERIERQSQTHFPTWKSRCVHWPYCTNNHCKYSHPIKECRMGDQCTFMERCMFLHPSDFMEPVKKRHTPKKAQTLPQPQTESQPEPLTQV